MIALFCVMDSAGLALQMIGLARELQARGHTAVCVANEATRTLCEQHALVALPSDCEQHSFRLRRWMAPPATLFQLRHLEQATAAMAPDVIVATPFGFGAPIAAERLGVPLVVVGGLVHLWQAGTERRCESARWYRESRIASGLAALDNARAATAPWLGDRFLLPSVPRLSGASDEQDRVCHVGDCTWDPPAAPDPELDTWLGRQPPRRPVAYVQCGREFGATPITAVLARLAAELDIALAIDTGRGDRPYARQDDRTFARPFIPRAAALPRASVVITSGQPAIVLGAVAHEVPMVLLPNGSGTEEVAAACTTAGVAGACPLVDATDERLAELIAHALRGESRAACAVLRAQLAAAGGLRRAATEIIEVGGGGTAGERDATRDRVTCLGA